MKVKQFLSADDQMVSVVSDQLNQLDIKIKYPRIFMKSYY